MSDDHRRNLFYRAPFDEDHQSIFGSSNHASERAFDPSFFMTDYTDGSLDYASLSKAFTIPEPPSSSGPIPSLKCNPNPAEIGDLGNSSENPETPYSSVSFSSSEAGGEEDTGKTKTKKEEHPKLAEDGGDCSKKGRKTKKMQEKKQKEQRFAFMTKSEVDHLEDGYRWRKYGQKAVKNSPFPRSYYRCTTQKCTVKKRVERSYQDPSIVITTYEGQHNHPIPATLRGNAAAIFSRSMLSEAHSLATRSIFPPDFLIQMPHLSNHVGATPSSIHQQSEFNSQLLHHHQVPDYGLLQDVVPSPFFKPEP